MIKYLMVFDIDDTLTRSESQHQGAYVETMKKFGITKINTNWNDYEHHTDSYILKEIYEKNFPQKFDFSFIEGFEEEMTKEILKMKPTEAVPGAIKMLEYINGRKEYGVCFATGSLLEPAYIKLNQSGFEYKKSLVVGSNNIYKREGIVSQAINLAKEYYEVDDFENIISFGDGIWDLKTAKNLGIHFVGIGRKNYVELMEAGVNYHLNDWEGFDLGEVERVFC